MKKYSSRYVTSGKPFCARCKCWISDARLQFCFSPQQRSYFGGIALCDRCEAIGRELKKAPAHGRGDKPLCCHTQGTRSGR